jgi:hypothetical protein
MSYILSGKAKEILERKSQALKMSKSKVLEWMIMEFSPSTNEERKTQGTRQHKARAEYVKGHTVVSVGQAYRSGYLMGWHDFQIRKSTHSFRLEE